ncbi:MAG: hypothetical protein COV74_05250 [Candidatus Omnitrophica bacterium CG11_big_fil_rev_8_21_14_0_20_45_26]|uniref:diguanylate cyclase n=1 Tax=Candidatus Abzuiibacterium crystallinum TaxID=1974748 RepID=A0A2H0LPC3_9BACT|nr:MAG: hypothetical protein COV74_05250 [Candidatus Omnitrophica bacterium CG11_big_fil_rev_8_21_14_0_20_45_26]PIW64297.1 MAG: hypothetical protein COW12_06570 [Candidatus Omnitrophica bacterium CG12_big_fil_rev_8_21_14_0_65_45_16]
MPKPRDEQKVRQQILEATSDWLLKTMSTQKFLDQLKTSLADSIFTSHVAVLVYDRDKNSYFVKMSTDDCQVPEKLVKLDENSPLIRDLKINLSLEKCDHDTRTEMKRFNAEMCFPIFIQDQLTGILMIGPRRDGKKHDQETVRFFQTITNEIAVGCQKEQYYLHSITDPLTGLYNRKYLEEALQQAFLKRGNRESNRVALAMIDIDYFKLINDRLGHQAGDEILKAVSQNLKKNVRSSDLCFRYGGEEFCILFTDLVRRDGSILVSENIDYTQTILRLIKRLKDNIASMAVNWNGREITISVSIGVTFLSIGDRDCTATQLISEADTLLYDAKRGGRNQVVARLD